MVLERPLNLMYFPASGLEVRNFPPGRHDYFLGSQTTTLEIIGQ
jgi:hypothetical protein